MKKFAVIGLGKFGFHAAKALFEDNSEVLAIDAERTRVQAVAPYATEALVLDAMDKEALRSLGLEEMDAVIVSTGTSISVSIMICLYLNELGVKRILVKAVEADHEKILRRVGATDIIHPERDMALRISRSLSRPNLLDFIPLSAEFDLIQIETPKKFVGRTLRHLDLRARYEVHIIAITKRDPEAFLLVPSAEYVIEETDTLIIMGKSEDIKRIRNL